MENVLLFTFGAIAFIAMMIAFSLLSAIPVWLLWNWLMPVLFGLPHLSFWQALGLTFLCSLLFKSSGSSSSSK